MVKDLSRLQRLRVTPEKSIREARSSLGMGLDDLKQCLDIAVISGAQSFEEAQKVYLQIKGRQRGETR